MPTYSFMLNGEKVTVDAPADLSTLWALRDKLGVTGPKYGCGIDVCKACTSHLDGRPFNPCVTNVEDVAGLVLAAGSGSRYGGPKALVPFEGELLVERAVRLLTEGGCAPVVVVLVIVLVVAAVAGRTAGEAPRPLVFAGHDLLQLAAVQPHAPALRAIIDLDPRTLAHLQRGIVHRALHDFDLLQRSVQDGGPAAPHKARALTTG